MSDRLEVMLHDASVHFAQAQAAIRPGAHPKFSLEDCGQEPGNFTRKKWAEAALETFREETGAETEDAVTDLLCALMHACSVKPQRWGEFARNLQRAVHHYAAETREG